MAPDVSYTKWKGNRTGNDGTFRTFSTNINFSPLQSLFSIFFSFYYKATHSKKQCVKFIAVHKVKPKAYS